MQSNEALFNMMQSVNNILGRTETKIMSSDDHLGHDAREYTTVNFNDLAKCLADVYTSSRPEHEIRTSLTTMYNNRNPTHVDSIKNLFARPAKKLDIGLIFSVYLLIKTTDNLREDFNIVAVDALSALHINAAYEIACRVIGVGYKDRKTPYDFNYLMPTDLTEPYHTLSLIGLLKMANIQINVQTLLYGLVPFVDKRSGATNYGILISDYMDALKKYLATDYDSTARTIYIKLYNLLERIGYYQECRILPFIGSNISIPRTYTPNKPRALQSAVSNNSLVEILNRKDIESAPVVIPKPSGWKMIIIGVVDWFWRMRMSWNGEYAVGVKDTLIYGEMFGGAQLKRETSFNYTNNRYLLETMGQSFVGNEGLAVDRKRKLFRQLALSYYTATKSIDGEDPEWMRVFELNTLQRQLSVSEDWDQNLDMFITTLSILLKPNVYLSTFHVMSAFIYFAKFILRDHALANVAVCSNTSTTDILEWMNYDL